MQRRMAVADKGHCIMPGEPDNHEHYEKRFCVVALEKGYLQNEQIVIAMNVQIHEDIVYGTHRSFREIFLEQDIMQPNQIEEVVKEIFYRLPPMNLNPA